MAMKYQHVTPHPNGGWQVKKGGAKKATVIMDTQKEAIERAKEIAKNQKTEVVIHNTHGRIRQKNSYGKPKGE